MTMAALQHRSCFNGGCAWSQLMVTKAGSWGMVDVGLAMCLAPVSPTSSAPVETHAPGSAGSCGAGGRRRAAPPTTTGRACKPTSSCSSDEARRP